MCCNNFHAREIISNAGDCVCGWCGDSVASGDESGNNLDTAGISGGDGIGGGSHGDDDIDITSAAVGL